MISYDYIIEAQKFLVENWGEAGKRVIEETHSITPFNDSFKAFLPYCTACGGNWGGMLLSGIKKLYPKVFIAIPDNMGVHAWQAIIYTLILCGIDTSEDD